jgi:hypothetical protein
MPLMRCGLPACLLLALALVAPSAAADDKHACVAASDAAQAQRADGHLAAARTELLSCARDVCPPLVRKFCEKWLEEVQASTPSVVIRVSDAERHDATDVRVLIDGHLIASTLDGRPLGVDPGVHVFRFEPAGAPAFEDRIVVVEGEKDRVLAETIPSAASFVAPRRTESVTGEPTTRPVPVGVYVLGGAAAVALAGFVYFVVSGESDYSACALHGCSASAQDSLDVRRALAWSSLGVSVAALGAGTVLLVLRAPHGPTRVGVTSVPGGGMAHLSYDF